MGGDGAHIGVSAGRALKTILGGDEPPTQEEQETREAMEQRIRARPLPGDGPGPWAGVGDHGTDEPGDAYSAAAESLAHVYLVLADERPALLTEQRFYDGTEMDDPWWRENMAGKPRDPSDAIYEAMKARWPNADDWFGGLSGFQAGWAFNAVRRIKEQPPAPNPAIMTLAAPDEHA
jgi:hypothetical protein